MKITTSLENINSFGGLNFVSNEFNSLVLPQKVDNHLGNRSLFAEYSYSDIFKSMWPIFSATALHAKQTSGFFPKCHSF